MSHHPYTLGMAMQPVIIHLGGISIIFNLEFSVKK